MRIVSIPYRKEVNNMIKLSKPKNTNTVIQFGCHCPCGGGKQDTKVEKGKAKA